MKLSEIIKILPEEDIIYVTTENNELVYEGKVCSIGAGIMEQCEEAEVSMLSPDWQEEIIIVMIPEKL